MTSQGAPYLRFAALKTENEWTMLFDKENISVPYVVLNNEILYERKPKTTRDLMEMKASLFSSEKLAQNFINTNEKENLKWHRTD